LHEHIVPRARSAAPPPTPAAFAGGSAIADCTSCSHASAIIMNKKLRGLYREERLASRRRGEHPGECKRQVGRIYDGAGAGLNHCATAKFGTPKSNHYLRVQIRCFPLNCAGGVFA
jgi:hypothetical protein